jgi:hypothetical protein
MPLFESIPVDESCIAPIVAEHWNGMVLGKALKKSQNHTFEASLNDQKFAVRVTPDPRNSQASRIFAE